MNTETKYRVDIQVLRGLAVLAVVLFHANEELFPSGYLGVDVFFVISGYVVTPLILRIFTDQANREGRLSSLKNFYKRRFYRLAPAMLLMLCISAILFLLLISTASHKTFGEQAFYTIFFVGNYGAFKNVGAYFNNSGNPLVHTWSLSVEEQIYIFLPLIMFILLVKVKNKEKFFNLFMMIITLVSVFLFISSTIMQPVYERIGIADSTHVFFYSPLHRVWQFTIGGLCFLLMKNRSQEENKRHWTSQVLVFFLVILFFGSLPFGPRLGSFVASLIAVLIIGLRSLETIQSKLTSPFEWLGYRSYSIYLFHMPLIFIAYSSPYFIQFRSSGLVVPIVVFLSILIGAMSYSRVENKYRIRQISSKTSLSAFKVILTLLTLSLLLSFFMIRGPHNEYWGLQEKTYQPPVAWDSDKNCDRMSDESGPPCLYKTQGTTKTVLLIGDSHAATLSQALIDASKKAKLNAVIWTMAGCNFALTNESGNLTSACLNRNNSILKWVSEQRPSVIVVSQYIKLESPLTEMNSAIQKLKSLAPNILAVGNTPIFPNEMEFNEPPPLFQKQKAPPKKVSISKMDWRNLPASNAFLNNLAKKGIETVNLNSIWCNPRYCSFITDNRYLFYDRDHLSVFGADLSVPYLTNFLIEH